MKKRRPTDEEQTGIQIADAGEHSRIVQVAVPLERLPMLSAATRERAYPRPRATQNLADLARGRRSFAPICVAIR